MEIAILSVLLAAMFPAPAHTARYKNFDCIFQHGPEYRWSVPAYSGERRIKSSTYIVEGFGTTCTFAKTWVRRLAKEPYRGARKPLKHGPAGWRCLSGRIGAALHPVTAFEGDCQYRKDLRRVFSWGAQSGYDDEPVDPPKVTDPPPAPEPVDPPAYP